MVFFRAAPIPYIQVAIFNLTDPYIESTTILSDTLNTLDTLATISPLLRNPQNLHRNLALCARLLYNFLVIINCIDTFASISNLYVDIFENHVSTVYLWLLQTYEQSFIKWDFVHLWNIFSSYFGESQSPYLFVNLFVSHTTFHRYIVHFLHLLFQIFKVKYFSSIVSVQN